MKYLITSALPYINGIKHLGNLIGSMLPADVYARFLRQQGEEVLYICGTDEHGTPAELAAKKAGQTVEEYCAELYQVQKEIYEKFAIQFDYFGRSSAPSNVEVTQAIFQALDEAGFIEERDIKQVYSLADERFLPDRYVEGTCPKCDYPRARGDQCDGCGSLLEPTDLLEPYSTISGSKELEVRHSKHLFLKLDSLQGQVADWVEKQASWSLVAKGIAKKWLQEGLHPRCISRDLKWGVPINKSGFEGKVFYVWFDAPNAYIAMTKDWAADKGEPDAWREWWCDKDVYYSQFMAKDNVPFHAVFWPAMLLGARDKLAEKIQLVDYIKSFSWLTYDHGKFSTSQGRGVFTDQALELFPADYWRYYLLANAPESSDADFTFDGFAQCINKDLADILGNFVARVSALVKKYFDGRVPEALAETSVSERLETILQSYMHALRDCKFRQAAQQLRAMWMVGNEYITETAPWQLAKTDLAGAGSVLNTCLHLIRSYAICMSCMVPNLADQLWAIFGFSDQASQQPLDSALDFHALNAGSPLSLLNQPLITKIQDAEVAELTQRFAG